MWFLRWATDRVKNRMWAQLGWFSGLVCVGSVAGAVAWGASMQANSFRYEVSVPGISERQRHAALASSARWLTVFFVVYPVEFLCFIVAKLMLMNRLASNAARNLQTHAQEQEQGDGRSDRVSVGALVRVYRVIAAAVVTCSVGIMVAYDVAGAFSSQLADTSDQAAASCDEQGRQTATCSSFILQLLDIASKQANAVSVKSVLETVALLLITAAYLVLVPLSVALFRRAERVGAHALVAVAARTHAGDGRIEAAAAIVDETITAAAQQRRRLVIACVVVLVTFPARAVYELMFAYAAFNDPANPTCHGACAPCQSNRFLMLAWFAYTPEFQPFVVALSSPLPLFVSLWIITGAHAQAYAISLNILRARLRR
jgi:hypothetical protein